MRIIGQLESESEARRFSDYLYAQGIESQVEAEGAAWVLWIHQEDQLEPGRAMLEAFRQNPADPKYQAAGRVARELHREAQRQEDKARKKFFDRSRIMPSVAAGVGAVTIGLVVVCGLVALLSGFGRNVDSILGLFISAYDVGGGWVARLVAGLPEVRHGQLWRLASPVLIHFGFLHLFFNLLWLWDLGGMVERHQGSWRFLILVVGLAIPSNFAQYLVSGPMFGGMSGVVYGLIGYIWLRGENDPASGLFLHSSTVMMMTIWYFLCLFGIIPGVANTVHTVGFALGLAWGYLSALRARNR